MNKEIGNIFCIFLLLAACTLQTACNSSDLDKDDEYAGWSAKKILLYAKANIARGMFRDATNDLDAYSSHYPFGDHAENVALLELYTVYASGKFALCAAEAQRFIELHPHNKHLDFAYYILGMSKYYFFYKSLTRYLPVERYDMDIAHTKEAFFAFDKLIKEFPKSPYAKNAQLRMKYLKNTLGKAELSIAKYYAKHGAWVAVANRCAEVVEYFDDTQAIAESLYLLHISYSKLGLDDDAEDALKILEYNYPEKIDEIKLSFKNSELRDIISKESHESK